MFANRVIRGVLVPSVVFYIVAVLAIVIHGHCLRAVKGKDPLARVYFAHPLCGDLDGWSVSHFLFFGLLGVLYPGHHLQFFLVGVGWEVVETILGQNLIEVSGKRVQLTGDQDEEGRLTGKKDAYWYGRGGDILFNTLGYCIGSAAAERYWPNREEPGAYSPPPPQHLPPPPQHLPPPPQHLPPPPQHLAPRAGVHARPQAAQPQA